MWKCEDEKPISVISTFTTFSYFHICLIYVTKNFATYILHFGVLVGHYAFGSRKDSNAQTILHTGKLNRLCVGTQTRAAYSFQAFNSGLLGGRIVFQSYFNHTLLVIIFEFVLQDITFVVQDLGDTFLKIGSRDLHNAVVSHLRITYSRQKICYRISYHCLS